MYAMVCTRPDIAHVVGTINRFLSNADIENWNAVKWILRYLHDKVDMKLCFGGAKPNLVRYSNLDVAWQSRLQRCLTLSTIEAKFIAITEACKESIWLKKFLQELGFGQDNYSLFVDS